MAPNIPSKIGKYDVLGIIGRGGMGVVYKAVDPRLDREVAIKMMTGGFVDDPDLRKRFFREAQSLASLQHPNIVTVYDLGDYEGNPYLVMQYMEGETLDAALANKRKLSFLEKLSIVIQVCTGLTYAHRRFVVHRDIKPANIMLEKDGGIKIFDFGIAHVGDQSVTKTGQMIGTPPYMSPEQINGKTIDARSDLFSLGVVLYQLCADHLPFQGDSPPSTFLKILYDPPPPLRTYLPSYPAELDAIIDRALAKNPAERYDSADEVALDLERVVKDLRKEVVGRSMREVGELLERAELQKARDLLLQVLRTDPQHLPATQSLRDVERRIKKEEIGVQVRRLRQQADECVARQQWESAQSFLEQALAIHDTDAELRQHAESVRLAIVQARKLREALKSAEAAHNEGDLDIAKQAIEEALEIAPNDAQAKALYRVIQREWLERTRQRQMETYLFQARQHISARNFSDAIETLKLAEALDPGAPQIHALMESATAGLEQERRHKQVQADVREIESALNRDDYQGACQKAAEALARFPEENTIIKLKALADRQRQIEERRQVVEEQLALARKLLQVNRNEELLASLEATFAKIGPETRLQSLLSIVTENVQRERLERRKAEYLQQARDLLRSQQYDSAIRALEGAPAELRNEPELDELLQFVREEAAADKRRREAGAAVEKARVFVTEQKYDDAIRMLESALQRNNDPDLRIALEETRRAAAEYKERMTSALEQAERLMQSRKFVEVVKLLESQPSAYLRNPAFSKLLEGARSQADRMRRIREVIDQSQHLCDDADYPGAHRVLEEWRRKYGNESELDAQDTLIEQQRTEAARYAAEKAIADARALVAGGDYQAGLEKLQAIAELVADLPEAMATEFRSLRQVAAAGLVDSRKSQIEQSVDKGELTKAGNILQQALVQFPGEHKLSNLGKVVEGETTRRSAAKQKLEEAQNAFEEQLWNAGGELLAKAFASSSRAPAVRAKVIDAFVQAAFLAVETDWRAAAALLKRLNQLKPDYDPPSLLRLQIREYEHEETVGRYVVHARALMAGGRLQDALDRLSDGLKALPDDVTLLEMRKSLLERIRQQEERARQDRARLEKEAFLNDVLTRVEQEPRLERRITILEEAQLRFPQEPQLLQLSVATQELIAGVSSISAEARKLEEAGKLHEALAQWNVVRTLHPRQTELDENIGRVTRLRDEQRAKAKAEWMEKLRAAFDASDFERTQTLLREAVQQFPQDPELTLLEVQLGSALKARGKAEKYMVDASKAFERSRWAKGIEALSRVHEIAPNDAVLKNQSLTCLAKASETALATDIPMAHMLLDRAAILAPSSPLISNLEGKIKEREREQSILDRLTSVRRAQQGGDLEGARLEVNRAIKSFPEDARFTQAKLAIERQLQLIEERKAQELERARQLELERDREREKKRQEELERDRARQRAREEEERIKREEADKRERLRAEETERKRLEDEKQKRLRAEQLEAERKEAPERERLQREEAERKRLEDEKQKRLRAEQLEQERKEAAERERLRAEEAERKRLEKLEQEKALALKREEERKREQERLKALEQEKQEAEKRRLEEKRLLQEEALQREAKLRQERELAKKDEKERKAQEKARKREERERKEAAAAEKRKQEQEVERLRKEERGQEALKQKEEKAAKPSPVEDPRAGVSATVIMGTPTEATAKPSAETADRPVAAKAESSSRPWPRALTPSARKSIYAAAGVVLVVGAVLAWRALAPHTLAIQVTTTPDGAAVTLSATDQSGFKRECVTPHCGFELAPGKYSLQVKHDGYEPHDQTIEVAANGARSFSVSLVEIPQPPPKGGEENPKPELESRLALRGLTGGSEAFVDGKTIGRIGRIGHIGEISVNVTPGQHSVKVVAKYENSIIVVRNFGAGRTVTLGKDDLFPPSPPSPEEKDWQTVLGSVPPTIEPVEQFVRKYANGVHRAEAVAMLENLYWAKDSQANSTDSYREYLNKFPQSTHSDRAHEEISFLDASEHRDLVALDEFHRNYPGSKHDNQVQRLRDDLNWERTNQRDEKSLGAYLLSFPEGRHANEANGLIEGLRADAVKPPPPPPPRVDERKAVLDVLERYKRAYQDRSVSELKRIWPGIGPKSTHQMELLFKASSIHLDYDQPTDLAIAGNQASLSFSQTLSYVLEGRKQKSPPARLRMQLTKEEATGTWVIESIR
jgi:serine/threonine protein kinase/tetratricopeptide (TPR) repeat protein